MGSKGQVRPNLYGIPVDSIRNGIAFRHLETLLHLVLVHSCLRPLVSLDVVLCPSDPPLDSLVDSLNGLLRSLDLEPLSVLFPARSTAVLYALVSEFEMNEPLDSMGMRDFSDLVR